MGLSKKRTIGALVLIAGGAAISADVAAADDVALANPLDLGSLVMRVLERNPSLTALEQAERAVRARAEQDAALPEPTVDYALAPASALMPGMRLGQVIRITQPMPWPGKRALAVKRAEAAVRAAEAERAVGRLDLAAKAASLFHDYRVIEAQLAINTRHAELAQGLREANDGRFRAGVAPWSEIAAAELELGHIEHEGVMLRAARATIVARINGLLHREPAATLPPPRPEDWEGTESASVEELGTPALAAIRSQAESARPELSRGRAAIEAQARALERAERERFPDLALMGEYNSMWPDPGHRFMLGVSVKLPIFGRRREGMVREADADLRRARAELVHEQSEIAAAVSAAAIKARESEHVLHLFRQRVLPAARTQVEAVRIELASGKTTVASLLQAEHTLRELELEGERLSGELGKSRVELDRALGRIPGHDDTTQAGGRR